ncbi:putative pre-rRNA processing protein [Aspergillus mulundensis]|uniref:rRNA biogenesis protein RRP36 n=1 Tax=Aspergillus mulundensis TaxID=1810919 RepID=A0A3D8SC78_9EURO|nr:rRNA biogenesis protein rrp36 [Aspergillus mulundensis]RDW83925.1 rRNA biogenesis protein rrp36 [Aspergillus mulundensis]
MAISDLLNRRVRAAPDEDEDVSSDESGSEAPSDNEGSDESGSERAGQGLSDGDDHDSDSETQDSEASDLGSEDEDDGDEDEDVKSSLNNISFGALAKAQASFAPQNKRRTKALKESEETTASPLDDIRARIQEAREQKRKASLASKDNSSLRFEKPPSRTSKHAPTVQSSKYAVSRKRTIVEPPSVPKTRDPRFDPTIVGGRGGSGSSAPSDAYAFLDDYRAAELKSLKEQLAKTKDVRRREALQREIRATADRLRSIENNKREKEILSEHKKREKQLIREGKKATPYFLKKSDVKKQALLKKYEGMKSKDRAKALERRRKKAAAKERKEMPMERRGFGEDFDAAPRKRQRMA